MLRRRTATRKQPRTRRIFWIFSASPVFSLRFLLLISVPCPNRTARAHYGYACALAIGGRRKSTQFRACVVWQQNAIVLFQQTTFSCSREDLLFSLLFIFSAKTDLVDQTVGGTDRKFSRTGQYWSVLVSMQCPHPLFNQESWAERWRYRSGLTIQAITQN